MKYKRAINLSLTSHEIVTVPDDEIWSVIIFKPAKGDHIWGNFKIISDSFDQTNEVTGVAGTPFRMGGGTVFKLYSGGPVPVVGLAFSIK